MPALDFPRFPTHDDAWYQSRLALPTGKRRVVIDTDCANEIDDQFALAWALRLTESMMVEAVYAEPFSFAHRRNAYPQAPQDAAPYNPPQVGMARSYDEIIQVYRLLGLPWQGRVFAGSASYLSDPATSVQSDAAHHLVATARACPGDQPLYVLALGCVTNIASALLLAPDIVDRIVVVWTSGFPSHAPHINHSFNLEQDLWASQLLLNSGVPLVYLPGYHVGAQLRLSLAEMERYVNGHSAMGNYLHQLFTNNPLWPLLGINPQTAHQQAHSWVIWDIICVAWLHQANWVPSELVRTPRLGDDKRWQPDASRPWMREAYSVNRDAIFCDFFQAMRRVASGHTAG